jgi:hypothetical protein
LPDILLRLSRLQALTKQYASSIKTLKRCFELTPPNILPLVKKEAEKFAEFEPILSSSEFAGVMATKSTLHTIDMECAKKWIGISFEQHPKYSREMTKDEINFEDWQLDSSQKILGK